MKTRRAGRRVSKMAIGLCALLALGAARSESSVLRVAPDTEIAIERFAASGDRLLVWLPDGLAREEDQVPLARRLAAQGLEVWRPDLLGARFLPSLESSVEQVPVEDVVRLLVHAARTTGKHVYLLADARAALLALRAAVRYQQESDAPPLAGAILLHPNLYVGPPEPGREAVFDRVVADTRLPVYVIQPERSPWHWRLAALERALAAGGAPVRVKALAEVRDRFYFRPDATAAEEAATRKLPALLAEATTILAGAKPAAVSRRPVSADSEAARSAQAPRGLRPYRGDPAPPALRLDDLAGRKRDLAAERGKVVLVNFWASWCPPCVHEMPSMQRLKTKLSDRPFSILAVNMGEDAATVRRFIERVHTDFPILLDRDGAALKRWKVFVFPTSFLIGADGTIRYALYGAIEWDAPEVIAVINDLMPNAPATVSR